MEVSCLELESEGQDEPVVVERERGIPDEVTIGSNLKRDDDSA